MTIEQFLEGRDRRKGYQYAEDEKDVAERVRQTDQFSGYESYISGLILAEEKDVGEPQPTYTTAGIEDVLIDLENGLVITILKSSTQQWSVLSEFDIAFGREGHRSVFGARRICVYDTKTGEHTETPWEKGVPERISGLKILKDGSEIVVSGSYYGEPKEYVVQL